MDNIIIVKDDITTAAVDAIVNAANPKMLGGGGVDGAIHRTAGPKLLEECRKVKSTNGIRCPFGEARITPGCDLKAKYVIHTVGPRYRIEKDPEKLLTSAYKNSLDLAISNGCESIAFPAISCGAYGYPHNDAAKISTSVCKRPEYKDLKIYFYLFSDQLVDIWKSQLESV
ncbi:MAG: O-acetyl-ADP-ribose deacetylase [Desulfobacterales bacterium]|nr:O-acetyl-ADP-ribose deacetylase [Desulfobacterales bacterium]MCP4158619.1 O-acetyl-ADP-ribose deacetylase [Deltaproteobacteria bacterium]